jgi:hypothetical protein
MGGLARSSDTVDILDLRIEEKCPAQAKWNQKAPNGHCVNIGARLVTHSPKIPAEINLEKHCGSEPAREDDGSANSFVD